MAGSGADTWAGSRARKAFRQGAASREETGDGRAFWTQALL